MSQKLGTEQPWHLFTFMGQERRDQLEEEEGGGGERRNDSDNFPLSSPPNSPKGGQNRYNFHQSDKAYFPAKCTVRID